MGELVLGMSDINGHVGNGSRVMNEHPNKVFKFVKSMKKDGKDVEGGRCMRGSEGSLNFSEKDRGRVWEKHIKRIMNEENEWDQNV